MCYAGNAYESKEQMINVENETSFVKYFKKYNQENGR